MYLSSSCILANLPFSVSAEQTQNASTALEIGRPVFVSHETLWPEHHVCICEKIPQTLLHQPIPESTLVFTAQLTLGHPAENRLIVIPQSTPVTDLFNTLQHLFDRYDAWETKLMQSLRERGNVTRMLNSSYTVFQNPLLLQASDFFLVAHSSVIDETPELSYLTDPMDSYDTLATSKLDPVYMESRTKKEPFYLPAYLSGCKELCVNLFRHGVFTHRLILAEGQSPIIPYQEELLRYLAGYVDLALAQASDDEHRVGFSLDQILTQIIDEKLTDLSVIQAQLTECGWNPSHRYCCLVLKMTSLDSLNLTSHYLCHHFEEIVTGSCAFQYKDELVIFINLTRYEGTLDELLRDTTPFLRDSFLKTGSSNAITGTADLRYCYLQARFALETGSKYQNYKWVQRFNDISISYLMDCCVRDMPAHMICSEKLLALQAYDNEHNSQYCETLRVYLETHLNAVQSSKKLFIHRSTFLYRLERIQEIVDIDFEDQNMLFYLLISMHISDLHRTDYTQPVS